MPVSKLFIFIWFLLFTRLVSGQPFICTPYSLSDGLVGNNINKIIQDHDGFMWIGTWDGLCRYDGHRFKHYTTRDGLPNDFISDIIEIKPGTLLVSTWKKKLTQVIDGKLKSATAYSGALITRFLKTADGNIMALSLDSGVLQWRDGKFIPLSPNDPTKLDDLVKINDTLYGGIENTSLLLLDQKFKKAGTEEMQRPKEYHSFSRDNHQNIWVKTNKGLTLLSKQQRQGNPVIVQPLPSWMIRTPVGNIYTRSILHDRKGKYWIGNDAGVFYLDSSGNSYHFTTANGLPTNIVTCIMQDREDNIWVGTSTGVVKIALRNNFRFIKASDGLPIALVHHLLPVDEGKALLFSNGKSLLDLRNSNISVIDKFETGWKRHFRTADDEVLIMRDRYVEIYSDGSSLPVTKKWNGERQAFVISRVDAGIYFTGKQVGFEFETPDGVLTDSLSIPYRISACVTDQKGNLWVGTWSHGVFLVKLRREKGKLNWETHKVPDTLFSDIEVRSIYRDKDNRVWVGSRRGGVVCLQMENESIRSIHHLSNKDLLSSNFVSATREDGKKNIWIGTGHGLVKLIPTDTGYRSFNFSQVHQVPIAINQINFLQGNQMVASGIDGLIMATDDAVDTLPPPGCFITDIITPGQTPPARFSDPFKLLHGNPNIIFQFTAPVFFNEKMVEFSYRLRGGPDTSWMTGSTNRSVNFASLSPGKYQFEVRAKGWNGQWGSPAVFAFTVTTPFYQQVWFLALAFLVIAVLFFGLYRYRMQQLFRTQKIRDHIAADLHDDIGSTLTNINILSDLSKKNISEPEKAEAFMDRIGVEVHDLQESLDDIIWSVNTKNDSLEETVYRMRRYASELFDAGDIEYVIEFPDNPREHKLGMQQRRDIYLLFKECVNNIYKHAEARSVKIVVNMDNNLLQLDIRDDGKGFNVNAETKRNGLKNLKERVAKWKGKMEIKSEPSAGTDIHIRIPVITD